LRPAARFPLSNPELPHLIEGIIEALLRKCIPSEKK
jgi:hypothetical protein